MPARDIARIEKAIWILIYGGLFAVVLGIASRGVDIATAWSLGVAGALATAAGVVLIWVRSRLREDGASGAQSSTPSREKT
jgi:hypothetical protein